MDDEAEGSVAARAFVRAVDGDDEAVDELVDLAAEQDWVAGWALLVALELRARTAEQAGGLPVMSSGAERRLDQAVAELVRARG